MILKKLIEQKLLEEFDKASIEQVKKRFSQGMAYLNTASELFANRKVTGEDRNIIIYTNIYNAARNIGEAFLLLHGYRAKVQDHHKTVIAVAQFIINDTNMDGVFIRLDKMRKNRNKIEYDMEVLDISDSAIEQSMKDVHLFSQKTEEAITKKDKQQKIPL